MVRFSRFSDQGYYGMIFLWLRTRAENLAVTFRPTHRKLIPSLVGEQDRP